MTNSTLYRTSEGEQAVMALYDAALHNWPVPYETRVIPTRQGPTFVIAGGEPASPRLILLHGAGGNSTMWAGDMISYNRRFRTFAVDLPGEAGKSTSNRPAWDSPAFAQWLEDVLAGLGIEQTNIAGISQGAWTALKFAVAHPERVTSLVLITPGGIVPDRSSFLILAVALSLLGRWGTRRLVDNLFGDQVVSDEVKDIVSEMSRHFKPRMGVLPIFSDDELRRLTMPTLLLGGTKDTLRNINKIQARLRGLLPDLTTTIMPGGGHALLNTCDYVLSFLKS